MFDGISLQLNETTQMLRDAIRDFAKHEIQPLANQIDHNNEFPKQLWPKLGALGILGITVSPEYGGAGLGYLEHVIAMEEISRTSGSVGLSYGAHSNLCINQLNRFCSPEQKARFLPKLISGEHVGALAMSEVGAGSDVMGMRLHAIQKNDHFVLNGNKMWITNGPEANIIIVYAKTSPEPSGKEITAFVIERDFPGFKTAQKLDKLGMRGSNTCELVFDNCRVPVGNILGQLHEGTKVLMSGLDYERVVLSGGPVGLMQACIDVVLPYIHERKQFGRSIGEFELIQAKVADMYTRLSASRAYLYQVAAACDQGKVSREDAAGVILFCAENATQSALDAIQCLGGNGYVNEYPTGRYLRDAKLYEIGAGTSEIRRMLIGRELFNQYKAQN